MIKLRTKFSDKPPDAACIECLKHDAAVANALLRAIELLPGFAARRALHNAAEILRIDFGIIEESP